MDEEDMDSSHLFEDDIWDEHGNSTSLTGISGIQIRESIKTRFPGHAYGQ